MFTYLPFHLSYMLVLCSNFALKGDSAIYFMNALSEYFNKLDCFIRVVIPFEFEYSNIL